MKPKLLVTVLVGMMCSFFFTLRAGENPLVTEFKTFVATVEENGKNYTEEQWKESNAKFDALVDKFKEQKDTLSQEEKDVIHDAIGRYKGLVTNSGFDSAIKGVTKTYDKVAGATTDAWNETKSFFSGMFKKDKDKKKDKKDSDSK